MAVVAAWESYKVNNNGTSLSNDSVGGLNRWIDPTGLLGVHLNKSVHDRATMFGYPNTMTVTDGWNPGLVFIIVGKKCGSGNHLIDVDSPDVAAIGAHLSNGSVFCQTAS